MSEMHTNTDTDADKYILNGVEVTPNEFIDIVTNFLEAQHSRVVRLNARIAELEAAQRWIPVSERLPEANTPVLTISKDNNEPVTAWLEDNFWWSSVDWSLSVTHWMPLPELPKECER